MDIVVKCSPRNLGLVSINSKLIGNHTAALRVVVEVRNWNWHTNVKVKQENDQSRGQDNKNANVRCYTCSELGHIKRNCTKGSIKKIEEKSTGSFYVKASIGDSVYTCLLDTGADRRVIPV